MGERDLPVSKKVGEKMEKGEEKRGREREREFVREVGYSL